MAADILILFLIAAYCIFLKENHQAVRDAAEAADHVRDVRQMWERQKRKLTRASYGNKQCEIVKKDMYKEDM